MRIMVFATCRGTIRGMKLHSWIAGACPILAAVSLWFAVAWARPVLIEAGVELPGVTKLMLSFARPVLLVSATLLASATLVALGSTKGEGEREGGAGVVVVGILILIFTWAAIGLGLVMPIARLEGM